MIIKRYLVNDMNEAMIRIRYELGGDAIIVSKRWVRQKGFGKFFKKKILEVTAASDDNKAADKSDPQVNQPSDPSPKVMDQKTSEEMPIQKDLQELKEMVYQLMDNQKDNGIVSINEEENESPINKLKEMELDKKIIDDFKSYCEDKNIALSKVNDKLIYQYFDQYMEKQINIQAEIDEKIWIFVGPTGVGKTTTIAKIAARATLEEGKNVGMITIDTYRIGAVEQLKTYASILGVPLEVVVTKEDLLKSVDKLKDCDLILIDSTGRSSLNQGQLQEMKEFLDRIPHKKNLIVLNATTRNKDMKAILKNYETIGYDYVILTKMDETLSYGSLFNISCYTDKPLSYITTGQSVPDDLEEASKDILMKYFWGEVEA